MALLAELRFSEDEELEEEPEMALAIDDASEVALDEELDDELLSDLRDCPASKLFVPGRSCKCRLATSENWLD